MIPPREFIRKIKPFSFLNDGELDVILSGLEVELFSKGKEIYRKGEPHYHVYVVFSGLVGLMDEETTVDCLSRGEVFGIISLLDYPYILTARAFEDTICYLIATDRFKMVFDRNERFASFFLTFISKQFRSFRSIASDKKILEEASFSLNIDRMVYKKPVVCSPSATIAQAVAEMDGSAVSSIVVVDDVMRPIGILTHKDLRRVILQGSGSDLVTQFMSRPVRAINSHTTVFDALTTMIELGIDHLVVTSNDQVSGVVTRKDIQVYLEPSSSIVSLYRKINKASSFDELSALYGSLSQSVAKLGLTGPGFSELARMIASVNDAIVTKVVKFSTEAVNDADFVWLHAGSSGRREQVLITDQDNAVIVSGDVPASFAERTTQLLAAMGIPRCPGDYMASNPKWNQPLEVWQECFRSWLSDPIPDHIRYLSVFLDLRPICGNELLYWKLVEDVKRHVTREAVMGLAYDAILIEPPLGVFGIIGLRKGLDLKTYGIYPLVNGIRVLGLEHRLIEVTSTQERLSKLAELGVIDGGMEHDLLEAFGFLQDLRLKRQARALLDHSEAWNVIKAKELSHTDLLILKESLKVVAAFQRFLMGRYGVKRPSF
ncbi:MAG: DUF294 nucleotidyltransferase-like domain-containing protein [Syntrophobacteraceae bacterium]